jgi:hypothetical protein
VVGHDANLYPLGSNYGENQEFIPLRVQCPEKKIKKNDARSRKKKNGCIFDLQTNH